MAQPRTLRSLLLLVPALGLLAGACFVACASGGPAHGRDEGSGGGPGTGGSGLGAGMGFNTGGGVINGGGNGSGGGPPLVACDVSMPCPGGQVCVAKDGAGVCGLKGNACTDDDQCQNDTYCCKGDCRQDGVADGVCVPGATRPVNNACNTTIAVGVFAPDLQCEWKAPAAGDPYPNHKQVLTTPLVADLPNDSKTAAEIIVVTSDSTQGAIQGDGTGGRIRILNGQDCTQEEVITDGPAVRDAATPAIGDLDNDGKLEIVARVNFPDNDKIVAFTWKGDHYGVMWQTSSGQKSPDPGAWDGISIHDLDNDGKPEVIGRFGEVYEGATGRQLTAGGGPVILESDPVLADVDHDGTVELVANKVFSWSGNGWTEKYPGLGASAPAQAAAFYGVADFGTRVGPGQFDHTKKDGIAEVVAVGPVGGSEQSGMVGIYTLQGEQLMRVDFPAQPSCPGGMASGERGGPPTIGDFDGDGMPEVASAGAFAYRVFDLDCKDNGQNCQEPGKWIRWAQGSQDCTSGTTGSTIFDFEGDGKAEAIYADECFVRVYDGKTGDVLFSTYRSSATWWEQPIIADPDKSTRSKIIFGTSSNANVFSNCFQSGELRKPADTTDPRKNGFVDKIYKGLRCATNADCPSQLCDQGFCRCTTDAECGNKWQGLAEGNMNWNDAENGLVCTSPIGGTPGAGNVCRMQHGNITTLATADMYVTGVRVFRDKLDRWASSRPLWNQHAYSITNINDNGSIPKTSDWKQNFAEAKLNNFRQNQQGSTSADLADITGALDAADACALVKVGGADKVRFTGHICNRGLRGVAATMPASFYLGTDTAAAPICQTKTAGPVPIGNACQAITCDIDPTSIPPGATITMVVNDAGKGARITDECNYKNNASSIVIDKCDIAR